MTAARSRDFKPVPLGLSTSLTFTNTLSRVKTANVGGVLPGNDPKLAPQVLIYSAHHDHFGIGEPDKSGDKIYHGAVDNASGCAQVLAIARAFALLPQRPRRSVMALFVAGEERGLLGSAYYAQHPSFPAGRIAANINIDGGNIFGRTREAVLVSLGKSSLDEIAASLVKSQGRTLEGDQFPDRGYYYRSDQFSFAKIGVPALYFSQGTDVIGKPAGWGKQTPRGVGTEAVPPAERQARRQLELRRHDRGCAAVPVRGLADRAGRCDADLEAGRRVRGGAQARARRAREEELKRKEARCLRVLS